MKKQILGVALAVVMAVFLAGCGEKAQADLLRQQISELEIKKSELDREVSELENAVMEKKEENGTGKYVLTLEIKSLIFRLIFPNT